MSGGRWHSCGPRISAEKSSHTEREILDFFHQAALEKQAFDKNVAENVDALRQTNAERRARDQRELDEEYRNYIPPIV